jgi:D-alanyl-D-alanine carboxypeptidase
MNRKARIFKLSQTKFADPSGLSIKNISTVRDIDALLRYIKKKYPILLTITTVKEYADGTHDWKNTSSLSVINGYLGGKTGFTTPAQQTASGIFLTKTSRNTVEPLHYTLLYSSNRNIDIELLRRYIEYQADLK